MSKQKYYSNYTQVSEEDWYWPSFTPGEIACKGTGRLLVDYRSMDMLQELRDKVGEPFYINSGYRSPEHNRTVGGAPNSYHVKGMAFDVDMSNHDREGFIAMAKEVGFKGFGHYNTFEHIDTRDYDAEWWG